LFRESRRQAARKKVSDNGKLEGNTRQDSLSDIDAADNLGDEDGGGCQTQKGAEFCIEDCAV
jgi:hypothetical protein